MSLKIGRVTLRAPNDVDVDGPRGVDLFESVTGISTPGLATVGLKTYRLVGREGGSGAQATMDLLERELARIGSMYCSDDNNLIPAGYYELRSGPYKKPRGRPSVRPWEVLLTPQPSPGTLRQAEDDNVAGTDPADGTASEAKKTLYTPTTSEVLVLDPRNAAGAEKVNLPAGTYRVTARARQATNSSAKLRAKTTKLDGTVITSGSQVAVGAVDTWVLVNLGTFTITDVDMDANWFEVHVQGVTGELGAVSLDYVLIERQ